MSSVAVSVGRVDARRPIRGLGIGLACLAAAVAYAAMRLPVATSIHAAYKATCAQHGMRPEEWLCGISSLRATVGFVGGSLLIGLAMALPCAVLAATGRRGTALVPLLAGLATWPIAGWPTKLFGISDAWLFFGPSSDTYWQVHAGRAVLVDAALLAVPTIAISRWPRRAGPDRVRPSERGAKVATLFVLAGIAIVEWVSGLLQDFRAESLVQALVMVTFAVLLGTDRRWWPWSLAPVALLLSLGPAMLVIGTLREFTILTWFRATLPLAALGLVASFWRPLALRFSSPRRIAQPEVAQRARAVRPAAIANALAVGLLAVSLLAARFDPVPVQMSESLPTYLGARVLAQDVHVKTDLHEAILAMEGYRSRTGAFDGFDAEAGEAALPGTAWTDGTPGDKLVVGVMIANGDRAQVVALSWSGAAICLQSTGGVLTLGSASSVPEARLRCAEAPWSEQELAMVDFGAICDEAPPSSVLLCRNVQEVIEVELRRPPPN